jgi:hypothetical protein
MVNLRQLVTALVLLSIADVAVWKSIIGLESEVSIEDVRYSKKVTSFNDPVTTPQHSSAFNHSRPVLLILVGPPKTATSTLQAYLSDPQTWVDLRKDNYIYQGRFGGKVKQMPHNTPLLNVLADRNCKSMTKIAREQKQAMPGCWNSFTGELDRLYQTGQNVILVEEYLSDASFDLPAFQQATTQWQTLIVITYRQFWSWLPSFKNQIEKVHHDLRGFSYKPKSTDPLPWVIDKRRSSSSPEFYKAMISYKPKNTDPLPWVIDKRRSSSSPEFYKAMISVKNRKAIRITNLGSGKYLPYTDNIVDMYQDLGDQVRIMNIHLDNMQIISNFICEILPNATNSCKASLNQSKQEIKNPSTPLDYQSIALDAVEYGLLNRSTLNGHVVRALEKYHSKKLESRPLPLECMDRVSLEAFLAESMRLERELVPDFYAAHEEQHRKQFWNAAAENKFCSVNTTAVLIDPDWLSLFAYLRSLPAIRNSEV